ncbi:hypothetical protein NFK58_12780 [Citrobacter portucalensis]|uniref:hypothetical protein n=1 Tax=Citrobacter portucalensis TaxID=1639133 RepID=UPI00243216ED|nr:hypothetical protein [Citrobacter portucalensis]WFZ22182.1 hypothetical protein NFK58_12780 [Citrobacter portucalensis]
MNGNIFAIAYLCAAILVAERLNRNIKKSPRRAEFQRFGSNIMNCAIFIGAALWPFFISASYLRDFKKFLSKKFGKRA